MWPRCKLFQCKRSKFWHAVSAAWKISWFPRQYLTRLLFYATIKYQEHLKTTITTTTTKKWKFQIICNLHKLFWFNIKRKCLIWTTESHKQMPSMGWLWRWWCSGFPQISQTQNQGEDRRFKRGLPNFGRKICKKPKRIEKILRTFRDFLKKCKVEWHK